MYNKSGLINNSKSSYYKDYRDIKKFDNLSLNSKYFFLAESFNDLNQFNKLKTQKEKTKKKKQMCMIQLRNYTLTCCELILMNTMIYQMQIEKNKAPNINIKCHFLNHYYNA